MPLLSSGKVGYLTQDSEPTEAGDTRDRRRIVARRFKQTGGIEAAAECAEKRGE
jgi:hypothetical protein